MYWNNTISLNSCCSCIITTEKLLHINHTSHIFFMGIQTPATSIIIGLG